MQYELYSLEHYFAEKKTANNTACNQNFMIIILNYNNPINFITKNIFQLINSKPIFVKDDCNVILL